MGAGCAAEVRDRQQSSEIFDRASVAQHRAAASPRRPLERSSDQAAARSTHEEGGAAAVQRALRRMAGEAGADLPASGPGVSSFFSRGQPARPLFVLT
jgi:hypothetical protein